MRIATCLFAVLIGAALLAQEQIEWSLQRTLTRADFRGRVPAEAAHASMSWIYIQTEWECKDGSLVADARATFDPLHSWFRRSEKSTQLDIELLEHEQLHFDIAEAAVRRIRKRFADFRTACADPVDGIEAVREMVTEADRELQEEQERYDRETRHGIDARAQNRWRRRIGALLN